MTLVFDIETGALPDAELEALLPEFDPDAIKLGNLKDPDKIEAKIEEARANHRKNFFEKAALSALTGRVLAIGLFSGNDPWILGQDDEAEMLREYWALCRCENFVMQNTMIGFNSKPFDLPFLIRRSWRHRVPIPNGVRNLGFGGRYYWAPEMIDLRDLWLLGASSDYGGGSLDDIARLLGCGAKTGSGADFAKLWHNPVTRPQAEDYLRNDLMMTARVASILMGKEDTKAEGERLNAKGNTAAADDLTYQ